ncbi:ATP-dependent DNA helicase [Pararcticibacter amylolyticus]|uniref:ATP-dependent endonuclease n=1 Tax=Pararcticibacter amylolyticus TaxID=2173175 RepID=A0A2U2PE57_9SPHI|nr:AAA family ATPase [Pararcticibacter amylolyticus]PWG79602.1 ATP-dependent endonuclease [Pararcticibacter amylolyticus]
MGLRELLIRQFEQVPTVQQMHAFTELERFVLSREGDECFVLKGYAGTGKTTIIASLVKVLPRLGLKSVLLAPTGRAAKVVSNYSGRRAFTIHKRIYRKKQAVSPDFDFSLAPNLAENTLFIVDEASMVSDTPGDFSRKSLMHDLVSYVYNGKNCKLMLVGDTAQLPPVGSDSSPALEPPALGSTFALTIFTYELTDVVRQEKQSGILRNATEIRDLLRERKQSFPAIKVQGYPDIFRMTGERLTEGLHYAYDKFGTENTLVICRSNKSANNYNQQIRNRILYREEEITGGDYLMIVRNNYYWLKGEEGSNNFIANGDIVKVRKLRNIQEVYGLRFADVVLEFLDYPDEEPLSCKILVDAIYADGPDMGKDDQRRFFEAVMEDYSHLHDRKTRIEAIRSDPYYNALHVKFSYAVTCHKAQGGQWDAVFIDQGFLTEEMINTDFLRWLYTAVTRSVKELFLVNFSQEFFT